jgi:AI-2 transport protein TqsA
MNMLKYAAAAGLSALIIYLMIVGNTILLPLVIAIFVWHLINALATATHRIQIMGKPLPKTLRLGLGVVILLVLSWWALSLVIGNIGQITATAPVYQQNLQQLAGQLDNLIGPEYMSRVQSLLGGVDISYWIRSLGRAIAGVMASVGTVAIYVAFLLLEQHSFDKKVAALFPDSDRQALARKIFHRIGIQIQSYLYYKTLISIIGSVASYIVMKIVGVDFAAFWALLIFALNYIPYIGSMLAVVFPTLLTLVQFDTFRPFVITAILLTIIQFTTGSILEPRIMGKGLNISPVIMLLSLAFWGAIWGVVGMFLAVPLMVVTMIICSHFQATRPIAIIMSADGELRS